MNRKTVLLEEELIQQLNILAKKESRDFSSSLRYAARIGLISLQNPDLTFNEIEDILQAKAEIESGAVQDLSVEDI